MKLSLAISPCPNDVFIFSGLLTGAIVDPTLTFEVTFLDVQAANEAALRGEFDVIKISYAAYPTLRKSYELLSSGGALGHRCGPLLLRNGAGVLDPSAEVLVPGEQTTANFLLDYFVGQPLSKRFLPFDALYQELKETPGAQGVVIHEKRFVFAEEGLTLLQDLGEHWEAQTGYPIPLGAIILRRGCASATRLDRVIRESLHWANTHRNEALALCRAHAQDLSTRVIEAHIGLYVNHYSHDLGADGQAAVEFFFSQASPSGGRQTLA